MSDCEDYREALELLVEVFSTPPADGSYNALGRADEARRKALLQARQVLNDNLVSHRHEGWEGPAEACPICRAHDAKRKAEDSELKAAAEADEYKSQLQDARAVIRAVVDAIQPLAPFLLAHARWDTPKDQPDDH